MPVLFSIIEHPSHPQASALYQQLGISEVQFTSIRKALQALKTQVPDIVVADFVYGYGNNYAGVNVSNLDVFLYGLQKYSARSKLIICVDKGERDHVEALQTILPLHAVLTYPITAADMQAVLT